MGLWFWKMLGGLRVCYSGGCLSSEEWFDVFWKVELSSVVTRTPEREVANPWKWWERGGQPKVQCHHRNFLISSLERRSSFKRSHLNYETAIFLHICFVHTLLLLSYIYIHILFGCQFLLWQVDVSHCAVWHRPWRQHFCRKSYYTAWAITQSYTSTVHKHTFHHAQPHSLCWFVVLSSKLRPAKEASCRTKISNWWLVVV